MSTGVRMATRTYMMYMANALMCGLFMLWFSDWIVVQTIACAVLLVAFCIMCYNDGGFRGEHDCTLERTVEKRIEEGKSVDEETKKQVFNKKNALVCILVAGIPLCLLATANLIASPYYPAMEVQEETVQSDDPFYYDSSSVGAQREEVEDPAAALRVITRVCFLPLLPLYTILQNNTTLLYILFIPFSFVMPACMAAGYLNGPKIREKKIEEIARGKVRKRRGLLVGGMGGKTKGPRQPKPKV